MKTHNWICSVIIYISLLSAFIACSNERIVPDNVNGADETTVEIQIGTNASSGLTTGSIRLFAFDQLNKFIFESDAVKVQDVGLVHKIELPITQPTNKDKLVLLANAGNKGDQSTIATPLIPMIATYPDVMVALNEVSGRLADPTQFFYGKDEFELPVNIGVERRNIVLKNLCARTDVKFINVPLNTIDSVVVYIENSGKEIRFDGTTKSIGTTKNQRFTQSQVESQDENSFLLFPSESTPKIFANFYFKNGHVKHFSRTLTGYNFVSNKVLNFEFNLANIEDKIDLNIEFQNWDGTISETVYSELNFNLNLLQGKVANYTKADILLHCNYTSSDVYPIRYEGVDIVSVPGQPNLLKLAVPVNNVELRNYTVKSIRLKDRDGWFEALESELDFDVVFNLNVIDINVLGRKLYEDRLIKKWFKELDGNNGSIYPGTALMSELNGGITVFDKLSQLGLKASLIEGEQRITGIDLPASYNSINEFNVPEYISDLKYFTYFRVDEPLIEYLTLSNMPNLTTVDFNKGYVLYLNLSGCKNLTSFSMQDAQMKQVFDLNISSTSIKSLPDTFFALDGILYNLTWSNAGLTDAHVNAFINKLRHNMQSLVLSDNLMTVYPKAQHMTSLEKYDVSGNNIVSCALAYMKRFGSEAILPQRTGMNWWCP